MLSNPVFDPGLCGAPSPSGLGALLMRTAGKEVPLPLREARVRAALLGSAARVEVSQTYDNPHAYPIEVVHIFPLPPNAAVIQAELRCGEVTVSAVCKERREATATYEAARDRGQRAALLTQERADVHTLTVANLPPGARVVVTLVLVEQLDTEDGRTLWRFPTTIAPRYTPGTPVGHAGMGAVPDTDQAPDASRLQPPLRLSGGARLDLEVTLAAPARRVCSSLHAVSLELGDQIRVAPLASATLDRDFVLAVTWADAHQARTLAWTDGVVTLVSVQPPLLPPATLPRDAVFVIDISGSMAGEKIRAARKALSVALRGLVAGDRFRLIAFDDVLEIYKPGFEVYSAATLAQAERWVQSLQARNGTEMLPALREALDGETPPGRLRTVLFITDGQVTNDGPLLAAVAGRRGAARLYTLGIDTAVNAGLLQQLARLGGGVATLCTPNDDIEAVIAGIEARFGSPVLDGLTASGGEAARPEPRTVWTGRPESIWLRGAPAEVLLQAQGPQGPWTHPVRPERVGQSLLALWARERVAWLEERLATRPFEEEAIRGEVLRVALEAGITSRYTAFVAVDPRVTDLGPRVTVVQPTERPAGWEGVRRQRAQRWDAMPNEDAPLSPGAPLAEMEAGATAFFAVPADKAKKTSVASPPAGPPRPAPAPAPAPAAPASMAGPAASEKRGFGGALQGALSRASNVLFPSKAEAPPPPPAAEPQPLAKERAPAPPAAQAAPAGDPAAWLASTQEADGSFGGDLGRTAAALLLLVLLGHTRLGGLRRRVVQKAAAWLLAHRADPRAAAAFDALEATEAGQTPVSTPAWQALAQAGAEGAALAATAAQNPGTRS